MLSKDKNVEPTTKKELSGWYGYGWASEPYS
jgi:MFS-type transporter involved in bile tolerance (Atg22 family)